MGSSQSSTNKSETFIIDANGKIARVSANKPKQTVVGSEAEGVGQQNSSENNPKESVPGAESKSKQMETSPSQNSLTTLNNSQQRSEPSDQLRLREIDDILNRMKVKYKPNSAGMSGKGVFEDIENRLMHCYKVNKDQALKCATLAEEYRSNVEKQRAEILVRSTRA